MNNSPTVSSVLDEIARLIQTVSNNTGNSATTQNHEQSSTVRTASSTSMATSTATGPRDVIGITAEVCMYVICTQMRKLLR